MPCCKCNGSGAHCKGCLCAKSNKGCVDCYPGRRGKCSNASNRSPAEQASSQQSTCTLSLPCSLVEASASQPSLASLRPRPSPPLSSAEEVYSPPHSPQPLSASPQGAAVPPTFSPCPLPLHPLNLASSPLCLSAHPATDLQARRDPPESQLQLPQSQLPQSQAQLLSSHSEDELRTAQGTSRRQSRKPCPVEGCLELIVPLMGKAHMTLHVQNILPGDVPLEWLQEQDSFVCLSCHHIVANSRFGSHSTKCSGSTTGVGPLQALVASTTAGSSQGDGDDSNAPLPSFEEVCSLRCATVHHIPQKARPAFARALSETLRAICQLNTEEAWLKLFMLPKCVLRASHRGGSRYKPLSIEELCRQWSDGQSASLWRYASEHARKVKAGKEQHSKETGRKVQLTVSKAREGLLGKACKVLSSSGVAPNTRETWNLLEQKYPRGPVPSHPEIMLPSESFKLPPDLDIRAVLYQLPRDSVCGPSGLAIVNILAVGRAPNGVAKFLAGGSLTALMKNEEGSPLDICPIVVLGVAYPAGAEKLVHGFRRCISEHWGDREFVACKVDLKNAFNEVSRQALLEECATHFPELFQWVYWCYGQHPTLWHPMGTLGSEQGVHQGDPLGPLLFSLVLQKLVQAIAADKECSNLLFNRWYLDDGTLAGPTDAIKRAIQLIQQIGPPMGLRINATKCELISQGSLEGFPADMKRQHDPNVEILGAPIGDVIFCAKFLAQKQAKAVRLLSQVAEVGSIDPQIALLLLRQCASFCKLVHVARSTPPSLVSEGLALFDGEVRCYFSDCVGIDASDAVWHNSDPPDEFSRQAVSIYNSLVPQASSLSHNSSLESGSSQKKLSAGMENHQFDQLCATSTPANRARLLSASSRHASSWLAVIPSRGLNLCMEPEEFQVALKWWLGMDTSPQQRCPHCHDHQLDPLGHHAVTCKGGGDAVVRHNALRDVFAQFCHRARLGGQLEVGYGLGGDVSNSRPADFLVPNWTLGKPAAFDLTVVSPLNSNTLIEAGATSGSAAGKAEVRKHNANDPKCRELGWVCIPLAVESYGCWGEEAHSSFSRLAARLALQLQCSKSKATTAIYQRLNLTLVRCNARAMLSRARLLQSVDGG
ncbi:hypothetical protein EMCRGX_G034959 [Ephydatia muelleri]